MLPTPTLDDRTFQQLVDEAKRLVQRRCPDWTDHNVSDPGVTLIEAFAQMVDQLIYRLNRVPDRQYVKFLELIGVQLRPPAAATGDVTFYLAAPQPHTVLVREGAQVATARTDLDAPVVFSTTHDLQVIPSRFTRAAAATETGIADLTAALTGGQGFACFSAKPRPGDALHIGLNTAVPRCAVRIRMDLPVSGVGVIPDRPPLIWEAWTGRGWERAEVETDTTGGLNRAGDVLVHVPRGHVESVVADQRAGWLRCQVVETSGDQRPYQESPRIRRVEAFTVGATADIQHAEVVRNELLGRSDGTPAQRFTLQRRPVVRTDQPVGVVVQGTQGEQAWQLVDHFADSDARSTHFTLDPVTGEIAFGPQVRQADGSVRSYGAVPEYGAPLVAREYRCGGGRIGNLERGRLCVLKTSVPYVSRVLNRHPAAGGVDAESLEDAKIRGPLLLRSRGRAVTAEDIEGLTRDVAPEIARAQAIPATAPEEQGGIRVLVVPHAADDEYGTIGLAQLMPRDETLERIAEYLDARRLVGTRLNVSPPSYHGLTAVVEVRSAAGHDPARVQAAVLSALNTHFHPLRGGPDGTGWPFGRQVQAHEVTAILARTPGVDMSREVSVKLFPADPATGRRAAETTRIELPETGLPYSYEHQVKVRR